MFLALPALGATTIAYIVHDADSQAFQLCVPELVGEEWFALDFDTASLNITIAAIGGIYTTFDYSGGNIDDGPTDKTWGNPTTSAIEIEALSVGATTGCVLLSVRDEVFAVANASKWSITVSDGGSALMDQEFIIFASVADSIESKVDTVDTNVDSILVDTGTAGVVLTAAANAAIWAIECEDQAPALTCREAMSIILAEAAGTAVYTSGTRTWVVKDPSGTETRLTIVYGAELDGDRTTSTLAPMTP